MERPALERLLEDVRAGRIDVVVVYKVDRLTRSLADFAKIVEIFDANGVSFVSVTQQFNTTTSMGRLTLNVLLSFAQFEREVTGERIRDKIAASKKKGMWMGGFVPLGYEPKDRSLVINEAEAETVRTLFELYLKLGNVRLVQGGSRSARPQIQAASTAEWPDPWRRQLQPRRHLQDPVEPDLCRRDRPQGRAPSGAHLGDRRPRNLGRGSEASPGERRPAEGTRPMRSRRAFWPG